MEQPQQVIEAIGKNLQETCEKLDALQVQMDDVFNKAKEDLTKLAGVLIDFAQKPENTDAPPTD